MRGQEISINFSSSLFLSSRFFFGLQKDFASISMRDFQITTGKSIDGFESHSLIPWVSEINLWKSNRRCVMTVNSLCCLCKKKQMWRKKPEPRHITSANTTVQSTRTQSKLFVKWKTRYCYYYRKKSTKARQKMCSSIIYLRFYIAG